jgi:hypothetical protein
MTDGSIRTLRFEGEYIYGEVVLSEAAVKAGIFFLMDVKKDGDKYVGKINGRTLSAPAGDKSCSVIRPIELTLVRTDRIEGRRFVPPPNAKVDWSSGKHVPALQSALAACIYSPPADWQSFTWIPVK